METPSKKPLLKHFSHEHVLEHTRISPPKAYSICFGCKLEILPGKQYYKCKTCPFFLHQVCYDMPQQVQHPVDPKHQLILMALPSLLGSSIECQACQQNITGFYYNCARCGHFYHTLCLAAPLSVKLPVHFHTLELEFSPPYDFQCDLCDQPSYCGWLYRCGLCEFDSHISCALVDRQAKVPMLPGTNTSGIEPRIIDGIEPRIIDAGTERKDNELMELISRGMMGNEEIFQKQSHLQDQTISIPEDRTPPSYQCTPSYQFSDACFSIDFARSFLNDDQTSKKADFQEFQVPESKETEPISYVVVSKGLVADLMQVNPTFDASASPSFDLTTESTNKGQNLVTSTGIGSQVWLEIGQENPRNTLKTSNYESAAIKQIKRSKSGRYRCLCW